MRFLGNIVATIIGLFVFVLLFFFGIVLITSIFGGENEEVTVKNNSVIELNLANVKNDYAGKYKDPWITMFSESENVGVSDIIKSIETAKTDSDIKGISILNNASDLGMAQRKEIRDALESFKKSGKFVLAYANSYSQKEYYLNSVATSIYLNPAGDFDFKGLAAEVQFFKELQEKSGVKLEVIRHGKYKSAVEPFLENKMSDANREQTLDLLNSIWSSILADISKSRKITVPKLNEIANGLLARTPEMAKAEKLVDFVAYEDEYHDAIRKALNVSKDKDYEKITIVDYAKNLSASSSTLDAKDKIAIIYAQGEIMSGEGDVNTIGEESMRRSLIKARKDESTKAIVLRIDSPGGNALTSDLIWREIEVTKKVKPIVVSMGNYAASGGYYIACNANTIFAEQNTITGSIGVFGILPNFTQLASKIGLHTEQVKTNENAPEYSPFLPIDENFKAVTTEGVERIYQKFVSHVAQGRKMSYAQVDAIAQGRVWSGEQALQVGLVDKIGGLEAALNEAAKLSKISKYSTENFPEYKKSLKDLFQESSNPFSKSKSNLVKEELGEEAYKILQHIKRIQARKGVQALLPFEITIR